MEKNKNENEIKQSKGLLLTRKKGEKIIIGKSVQIEVVDYNRNNVILAINAPKNIPVYRKEVLDEIIAQNEKSLKQDVSTLKQVLTDIKLPVGQL